MYRDELFNYKAAFVSFVALRDFEETAKLSKFSTYLQDVENHLPIKPEFRNPKLGTYSPIVAVNVRRPFFQRFKKTKNLNFLF